MWTDCQASCSEAVPYILSKQTSLDCKKLINTHQQQWYWIIESCINGHHCQQKSSQNNEWTVNIYSQPSVFLFSEQLHSTPLYKCRKKRVSCPHWESEEIKSQTQHVSRHTHTHIGDIQACFQHLLSKGLGVISLKKTWGWNLTLLLALCRLKQSSCHCDCHYCCVSNGGPANVSHRLGTSESPPALSDWGAIYLSASTSTLSLLNPSIRQGPREPMENTHSHIAPKSIKTMVVKGTPIAKGQVSALNNCNHLLTGADRNENWWTVTIIKWEFLYWLSDRVIVRSERHQKAEKQVWVYSCMSMYTRTHAQYN